MPEVPHGDLMSLISASTYSEEASRQLVYQILLAVEYLHQHGIAHRDLKVRSLALAAFSIRITAKYLGTLRF